MKKDPNKNIFKKCRKLPLTHFRIESFMLLLFKIMQYDTVKHSWVFLFSSLLICIFESDSEDKTVFTL